MKEQALCADHLTQPNCTPMAAVDEKLKTSSEGDGVETTVHHADEKLSPVASIDDEDRIIITGSDAAHYLLPLRDDGDDALTLRSFILGTLVAAFQAAMNQIYMVSEWSE